MGIPGAELYARARNTEKDDRQQPTPDIDHCLLASPLIYIAEDIQIAEDRRTLPEHK